ncbi:hypothetical protein [Amorphus coralli]|uniref:hypothetical protein n=1 Tax=Amorphus coralli TaxID=340680 RepID=UPI000379F167|nr:hypothetical protein [Amorphus coralli]
MPSQIRALPRRSSALVALVCSGLALAACVPPSSSGGGKSRLFPNAGGCLTADQLRDGDGDIRRHPSLAGPNRCVTEQTFEERGRTWTVQTIRNTARSGPLWVLPHDDEQAAVETLAYALEEYGGTAVLVETGGRRTNRGTDPNRAFDAGRSRCTSGTPATRYVAAILSQRRWGAPVIALHTNAPGIGGRHGGGSVSIRAPGRDATAYPGTGASGRLASEDSLVITAVLKGDEARAAPLVERLTARGVNVMVETTSARSTDCSLSHYAALAGIRPYLNIEVADGDADTQRRMLDIVMKELGE